MAATPKHRRSKSKQRSTRSQKAHKPQLPKLVTLGSGKRVPSHRVTADNPTKKGVKFVKNK